MARSDDRTTINRILFVLTTGCRWTDMPEIINEKDSIKIIQKGWIKKYLWREINDILRLNGFSWLSNGNDSCWIKELKN